MPAFISYSPAAPLPSPNPRGVAADRTRHVLYHLAFATVVCAGMLVARALCSGKVHFVGFFGNLLLAWIPLGLAMVIRRMPSGRRRFGMWSAMVLWALFFPNAFYIVTDLMHTKKFGADGVFLWFDIVMTASFACVGLFLGCLSLYLMHLLVRERFGWRWGWCFAAGMLALGSFGIYLGRFVRLNSWDAILRPFKLARDVSTLADPASAPEVAAFTVTFFFFSLAVYGFVVSMARLHEGAARRERE